MRPLSFSIRFIVSVAFSFSSLPIESSNPRVSGQNTIEHAMQMIDRYNRPFLWTLRQLRDLRRYSTPITIDNPQQVNIAADGGKQVNAVKVES
ncbi:MAG TPA: hypothetical protein VI260_32710 [Blastocatellia bacterium]